MTSSTKITGDRGEDLAVQFLQAGDYEILDRNWRHGRTGEIDIVARREGVLIFAEVKRSRWQGEAHPELRVDHRKQIKLAQLAQVYLSLHSHYFETIRFDIITVKDYQGREIVEHLENAFWPPDGWDK